MVTASTPSMAPSVAQSRATGSGSSLVSIDGATGRDAGRRPRYAGGMAPVRSVMSR